MLLNVLVRRRGLDCRQRPNRWLAAALTVIALAPPLLAQTSAPAAPAAYSPPRTPWGDPDLQGIWPSTHMVEVPLERPERFGTRLMLTDAEFKELQQTIAQQRALAVKDFDVTNPSPELQALGDFGDGTSPPPHWLERGEPSRQSSLIVLPANGRLPKMTSEGEAHQKDVRTTYVQRSNFSRPDDLGPYDRCISRGIVGSMMPVVYNTGTEIMQTPGSVVLRHEMIHETRVVPLDGRAHLSPAIKSYMGNSRGRWDGNTLVVRTVGVNGRNGLDGNGQLLLTSDRAEFIERFTPIGPDTLQYEVTITDPATWTAPVRISFPLRRQSDYQLLEYACHEGNYSIRNTLSGSRAEEK
ncbi:MAG TPA: hypothetical protein VFV95_18550 [Vicinamibacterales bacterium]|nr:hypothetical protein [Vicinamibacterales bacterium]